MWFPNLKAWNNLRQVDMPLKSINCCGPTISFLFSIQFYKTGENAPIMKHDIWIFGLFHIPQVILTVKEEMTQWILW